MNKVVVLFLLSLIAIKQFAQPCTKLDELYRKIHTVEGRTYGHPYTIFDRHNGLTLDFTIKNIKENINQQSKEAPKGDVFQAYQQIYNHANSYLPPNSGNIQDDGLIKEVLVDGGGSSASERALWAKNCAFVMLIGLDGNGDSLTLSQRNAFKYKAIQAFDNLNGDIPTISKQRIILNFIPALLSNSGSSCSDKPRW